MQVSKRHLPIVGLIGLVVVAVAGGGIYYYQFVVSHAATTYAASHRLIFINATVVENSPNHHGFQITNTAFLNQTNLPGFSASGGVNWTRLKPGLNYTNYKGESDNSTIDAHPGDTITFYIYSKSEPTTDVGGYQYPGIQGHGFEIDASSGSPVVAATTLTFGQWFAITATFTNAGTYLYYCTIPCSALHFADMKGNIVVG